MFSIFKSKPKPPKESLQDMLERITRENMETERKLRMEMDSYNMGTGTATMTSTIAEGMPIDALIDDLWEMEDDLGDGPLGIPSQSITSPVTEEHAPMFSQDEMDTIMAMKDRAQIHARSISTWNDNMIITGGIFTSMMHSTGYKDIDVFILDCHAQPVNQWLPGAMTDPKRYVETPLIYQHNPKILTVYNDSSTKFQYVLTEFKTLRELLDDFDYLHCCAAYHRDMLHIGREIFDAIKDKKLIVNNKNGLSSRRLEKFLSAGFKV
jgi:hypothetical protein